MQAFSPRTSRSISWSTAIMVALGFWLSGSLVFDFLIVPGMLTTGMMNESGFASAGYVIFGTFNHVELLCAATILAGCLVYRFGDSFNQRVSYKSVLTAATLLAIALVYTYIFTPQMSSAGMPLDMFANSSQTTSSTMMVMHLAYWSLEVIKLVCAGALLRTFFRNSCSLV
jgi:hypothetical protein